MSNRQTYTLDLLLAWLLRLGLLLGVLAIMAMTSGCSPFSSSPFTLPSVNVPTSAITPTEKEARTRNDIPQDGGCHEKSDSSLRGPNQ